MFLCPFFLPFFKRIALTFLIAFLPFCCAISLYRSATKWRFRQINWWRPHDGFCRRTALIAPAGGGLRFSNSDFLWNFLGGKWIRMDGLYVLLILPPWFKVKLFKYFWSTPGYYEFVFMYLKVFFMFCIETNHNKAYTYYPTAGNTIKCI